MAKRSQRIANKKSQQQQLTAIAGSRKLNRKEKKAERNRLQGLLDKKLEFSSLEDMLEATPGKPRVVRRRNLGALAGTYKKKWHETSKRAYTPQEKELAIRLRYGSLTETNVYHRSVA